MARRELYARGVDGIFTEAPSIAALQSCFSNALIELPRRLAVVFVELVERSRERPGTLATTAVNRDAFEVLDVVKGSGRHADSLPPCYNSRQFLYLGNTRWPGCEAGPFPP